MERIKFLVTRIETTTNDFNNFLQSVTTKPNPTILIHDEASGTLYDPKVFVESFSNERHYYDPISGKTVTSLNYNALPNTGVRTIYDPLCACTYQDDIKLSQK